MGKRKSTSSGSKDRISALPDSLIHTILSFIDMRYAVQASVLSKRWRYIWTSLPTLKLHDQEGYRNTAVFVNKVLFFRDSCHFDLDSYDECINSTHIDSWIATAVRRNVEDLGINCLCKGDFVIPPCLSTCKSLKSLILSVNNDEEYSGKIILPTVVSLPKLKFMSLNLLNLFFDDEYSINKFFSSCPALESLFLDNCEFRDMHLKISLPKLKCFELNVNLDGYRNLFITTSTETLTLYAPSLTTFKCFYYKLRDYSLENLSSLVTAHICVQVETDDKVRKNGIELFPDKKEIYAGHMMKLVRTLHNVTSLTLSAYFKVLSEAPEILDTQFPQFLNLQSLRLETWLSRECMHAIIFFLKISPNIESLCLDILKIQRNKSSAFPFCDEINFESRNQGDYWDSGLILPCMLHHLKFVKIEGLQGFVNELKFIEILLKNSTVLEEMVLFSVKKDPRIPRVRTRKRMKEKKDAQAERRMMKFYEMLLTFPRASTCTIILNPSDETMALP